MSQTTHTPPPYTPAEARSRETFLALMWALSYPGRAYELPQTGEPFALIGEALLDLETSFFTNDDSLADELTQNGARPLSPDDAAYHVYPTFSENDLEAVSAASVGTMLYPDRAATLIIACALDEGDTLALTGAGIDGTTSLQIGGIPGAFWDLRGQRVRFPLGWDIFFVDGRRVIGIPRSTKITR